MHKNTGLITIGEGGFSIKIYTNSCKLMVLHDNYDLLRPKQKAEDITKDSPKNSQEEEEKEGEEEFVKFTGRTASGMIKDMFNPYMMSSPGKTIPPSPSSVSISSVSNDSVFASPERTSSCSENAHRRASSSWKTPREMYESQQELVSASETITSEEEEGEEEGGAEEAKESEEGESPKSSKEGNSKDPNLSCSSTSSSASTGEDSTLCRSEGGDNFRGERNGMSHGQSMITISSPAKKKIFGRSSSSRDERLSPDRFLQNFNPKNKVTKASDQGYFTLRHSNKPKGKAKKKPGNRFSMRPQKLMSVAAEISSPSAVIKASIASSIPSSSSPSASASDAALIRHPAFRSKRGMRIGQSFSDTIPEASFTYEITNVPVVFKNTKMDISCRGK